MAITKAITKCIPYVNSSNKVDKWHIEMTYENNNEGDATYYKFVFRKIVNQAENGFTLKAKSSWSNADLVAICPVSHWDTVFDSLVDSTITNPVTQSTKDEAFNVPS
tara:strand:- start:301 stop:621 length:321 start_codon:yes stop_codon:yes gene_type:complete